MPTVEKPVRTDRRTAAQALRKLAAMVEGCEADFIWMNIEIKPDHLLTELHIRSTEPWWSWDSVALPEGS